jgi:hypothetical protein
MARRAIFWILGFYLVSGAVAVVVMPLWLEMWPIPGAAAGALAGSATQNAGPVPGLSEFLLAVLPSNIASAAAGARCCPWSCSLPFLLWPWGGCQMGRASI